jgi:hypothetical protein
MSQLTRILSAIEQGDPHAAKEIVGPPAGERSHFVSLGRPVASSGKTSFPSRNLNSIVEQMEWAVS